MATNTEMNALLGLRGKTGQGLERTLLMGVLNVTEDSFSDGGLWLDPQAAVKHAFDMAQQGADLIDIGAESTRPGSHRVPADLDRDCGLFLAFRRIRAAFVHRYHPGLGGQGRFRGRGRCDQ